MTNREPEGNVLWQICSKRKDETTDYHNRHFLKEVTFTRRSLEDRKWYVPWVTALFQVRFPKYHIMVLHAYTNIFIGKEVVHKRKISAAKAQITKVKNAIIEYNNKKASELFSEKTDIDNFLERKLKEKENNLNQLLIKKQDGTN